MAVKFKADTPAIDKRFGDQKADASALVDKLNLLTMQSFPESNPFPVMRVLDDGTLLYSNEAARMILMALDEPLAIGDQLGGIPPSWHQYLQQALDTGEATLPLKIEQKSYDLMMIRVDDLCVNIYGHDVSGRDQDLQTLQNTNVRQERLIARRTHELFEANDQLVEESKLYRALHSQLESLVMYDDLTGLPNRRSFHQAVNDAILRSQRSHATLAVMCMDLNGLKKVNDQFGHDIGDALLCEVAARLSACLRNLDVIARLGGDEFAVLVEEFVHQHDVHLPVQRMLHALAKPFHLDGYDIEMSASIGISFFPETGDSLKALLQQSDQAMYQAKSVGGGYQFYRSGASHG